MTWEQHNRTAPSGRPCLYLVVTYKVGLGWARIASPSPWSTGPGR